MKRVLAAAILLSSFCFAQQPMAPAPSSNTGAPAPVTANVTEHPVPVTRSDIYCTGFVTKNLVSRENFVAGGLGMPDNVRFADNDMIYLKGANYEPGTMVSIVREWQNPDKSELYKNTHGMLARAGQPYLDEGYARVIERRGEFTVARVEFTCDNIVTGDLVIPFAERPMITVRKHTTVDRFPVSSGGARGNIVLVRDGNQYAAVGSKVFLNLGTDKGLKPGDYFRVTRGYHKDSFDQADHATMNATITDDTQHKPPKIANKADLPHRLVGELVVLSVLPNTSTAMVTFMLEEMHAGDVVELEQPEAQ